MTKQTEIDWNATGRVAAEEARDEAISCVERGSEDWQPLATQAIRRIAAEQRELTTDDVWLAIGRDHDVEGRAMGAAMRAAASLGFIARTDRTVKSLRVVCHRRDLRVWVSLLCGSLLLASCAAPDAPPPPAPTRLAIGQQSLPAGQPDAKAGDSGGDASWSRDAQPEAEAAPPAPTALPPRPVAPAVQPIRWRDGGACSLPAVYPTGACACPRPGAQRERMAVCADACRLTAEGVVLRTFCVDGGMP